MKIYIDTRSGVSRDYNVTVSSYGRVTLTPDKEGVISRWTHNMPQACGVGITGYASKHGDMWGVKVKFPGEDYSEYIFDNEQDAIKLYSILYTAMGAS